METVLGQKNDEIARLHETVKLKERERLQLEARNESLALQLQQMADGSAHQAQLTAIREASDAKDAQIAELNEKLEESNRELETTLSDAEANYRTLQEESYSLHRATHARHRLKMFILLIVLDCKRQRERKQRTKAAVISWLAGKDKNDAAVEVCQPLELESAAAAVATCGLLPPPPLALSPCVPCLPCQPARRPISTSPTCLLSLEPDDLLTD